MDIEQLEKYKDECLPLTENDIVRLNALIETVEGQEFKNIIEYLLKHNIKLEQESIDFIS